MIQVIPLKDIISVILGLAALVAGIIFWNGVEQADLLSQLGFWFRSTSGAVGVLLLALNLPFLWEPLYKFALSRLYFPYINGTYDVVLRHNWPIIEHRLGKTSPSTSEGIELGELKLAARINIGFIKATVEFFPELLDQAHTIKRSRAIAVNLISPCDNLPHRLTYIFKQDNHPLSILDTDVASFYGAAVLEIHGKTRFDGEYWSNRSWQRGLNTPGLVEFKSR